MAKPKTSASRAAGNSRDKDMGGAQPKCHPSVARCQDHYLKIIIRRLVIATSVVLLILAILLYSSYLKKLSSHLVLMVFMAGLLGGFVSIQQRLKTFPVEQLKLLSDSWVSISLIPINGGIFALVLMLMFIGNVIQGELFPAFSHNNMIINSKETFNQWLSSAYPETGNDVAKLLFWSFVAGFCERFVPNIIQTTVKDLEDREDSNNSLVITPEPGAAQDEGQSDTAGSQGAETQVKSKEQNIG